MKKLSILIALCLLVTVGGVYATWVYAGETVVNVTDTNTTIQIAAEDHVEKGTIAVTSNTIKITIDDDQSVRPGVGTAYKAVFTGEGQLDLSFTADALASAEVKATGIRMKATLSLTTGATELTLKDTEILLNGGAATKTASITADQIIACLQLNGGSDLILDTYTEYQTFKTALGTPVLTITISEITTP